MDKGEILEACFDYVNTRIGEVEFAIESANTSLKEDTKSSAGDKYETGREMIQQDLNRLQQQLILANEDKALLQRVRDMEGGHMVTTGSLVETDNGVWYFITISIGRLSKFSNVYVISPKSPIGTVLLGKLVGEVVEFNKQTFTVSQLL